jgi:hypothetical protein
VLVTRYYQGDKKKRIILVESVECSREVKKECRIVKSCQGSILKEDFSNMGLRRVKHSGTSVFQTNKPL